MKTINFNRLFNTILIIVKVGILLTITDNTVLVLNTLLVVIEILILQMNYSSNRCKCTSLCNVRINEYTKSMRTCIMRLYVQFKFINSFTSIISLL